MRVSVPRSAKTIRRHQQIPDEQHGIMCLCLRSFTGRNRKVLAFRSNQALVHRWWAVVSLQNFKDFALKVILWLFIAQRR